MTHRCIFWENEATQRVCNFVLSLAVSPERGPKFLLMCGLSVGGGVLEGPRRTKLKGVGRAVGRAVVGRGAVM